MAKYKVLEAFELEGISQEVGAEIELTEEQATSFEGKVEKTGGETVPPAAE